MYFKNTVIGVWFITSAENLFGKKGFLYNKILLYFNNFNLG